MKRLNLIGVWIFLSIMAHGQVSGILHYSDGNTLHFEDLVCIKTGRSIGRTGILIQKNNVYEEFKFTDISAFEIKKVERVEAAMETASAFNATVEIKTRNGRVITDTIDYLEFVIIKVREDQSGKLARKRIYFGKASALIIKKIQFE